MTTALRRDDPRQGLLIRDQEQANAIEALRARLGNRDFLNVAHVASAGDVSVSTVYTWIEAGLISAMNVSTDQARPYYKIYRPSVVRFFEQRLGISESTVPVERRNATQGEKKP